MKSIVALVALSATPDAIYIGNVASPGRFNIIDSMWRGKQHDSLQTPPTKATRPGGWRHDCGQLVPAFGSRDAKLLQTVNPGAGMNPESTVPFMKVLKDGFHEIDCARDEMYEHGDKFGRNKFQYTMESVSNSSIVHYSEIVPKEDRKAMTPEVCFDFCRGLEDMGFFGISDGRDCYCTSYYKPMESDSSDCDSVCEGDTSKLCGGKTKNTIWSMHMCDTIEDDLKKAIEDGRNVHFHLDDICERIKHEAEEVNTAAADMQAHFGELGDPTAAHLLQKAKVYSGDWIHRDDVCLEHSSHLENMRQEAAGIKMRGLDFTKYEERKEAEHALLALQEATTACGKEVGAIVRDWALAQPHAGGVLKYLPSVLAQYYSIMYFIDKEFEDDSKFPVTCAGDMLGEPVIGARPEDCAAACDNTRDCVGFAAFGQTGDKRSGNVCFLYSKFASAQYYTGCDISKDEAFIQLRGSQRRNSTHASLDGFVTRSFQAGGRQCGKRRSQSTCEQRRASAECASAREATAKSLGDGSTPDHCFLRADNMWKHSDLPNYIKCLDTCCEDFDPERIFDGITCDEVLGFQGCDTEVDAYVPPGTTVAHICPMACDSCDASDEFVLPPELPKVPAQIPVEEMETVVIESKMETVADAPVLAMCRAKFSEFGGISLKPDSSGRNQFALSELTRANQCVH